MRENFGRDKRKIEAMKKAKQEQKRNKKLLEKNQKEDGSAAPAPDSGQY
ncbi:MAG: hypothetical protein HY592_00370 [Candidatus Omnitrophica bacterium]|nr:hypothetical protein [Candidatus Omnitrophota bacterium]